jgi:predicted murein hydrolase (TIGR00659 family)
VIRRTLYLFTHPALYILLTLAVYALSLRLHRRWAWIHPLLSASVALIFLLWALHIPYASYNTGGGVFTILLGPATVALGVPMYKQGIKLKATLPRLSLVVFAGSAVGMGTAGGVASLCGASHQMVMSALPKSVTTPIAIEVSRSLHGDPAITAAMVLLTGLLGSVIGPGILRLVRIPHDHAVGAAVGASSHAIGTASLFRSSEVRGSVSSLAMALAGIFTSVLAMLLNLYWRARGAGHPW